MSDESQQPPQLLDEHKRLVKVVTSQGKAATYADSLPKPYRARLLEFCSPEGVLADGIVEGVRKVFCDFYCEQKAVVDDEAVDEKGGSDAGAVTEDQRSDLAQ